MKRIVCEMCGSSDFVKTDGLFVCEYCDMKYSPDDAKKMIIEGTVDVKGTVIIDNTALIENYLSMANNAYDANNNEEAEMYCNKIIEIDLNNYKAWFLKGKAAGWQSTIKAHRLEEAVVCFSKSLENCPIEEKDNLEEETTTELALLSTALIQSCCNSFSNYPSEDNEKEILQSVEIARNMNLKFLEKSLVTRPKEYERTVASEIYLSVVNTWNRKIMPEYRGDEGRPDKFDWTNFKNRCFSCINLIKCSIDLSRSDTEFSIHCYKKLIKITTELVNSCSWDFNYRDGRKEWSEDYSLTDEAKEININHIMEYHKKIKGLDPTYTIPSRPSTKEGCYIATCIYESYDCPQVWTLRRYRDYKLRKSWYGKFFIHLYYAVSPKLVKYFGSYQWFKKIWNHFLDNLITKLQSQGFESTPYEDKKR